MHIMQLAISEFTARIQHVLEARGVADSAHIAESCAFLEACGYPGLTTLSEALNDEAKELNLVKDILGYDLKSVSCVYLAGAVAAQVARHGRIYLRNVRHGLYLLPDSVASNYGIGCPVDPSFHLGGSREKNPYAEKLDAMMRDGLTIDDKVWDAFNS
jgi:hypothetical protein